MPAFVGHSQSLINYFAFVKIPGWQRRDIWYHSKEVAQNHPDKRCARAIDIVHFSTMALYRIELALSGTTVSVSLYSQHGSAPGT
jgi:hypothetical protein